MVVMSLLNFIHIPFDEIQLLSLSEGLKKKKPGHFSVLLNFIVRLATSNRPNKAYTVRRFALKRKKANYLPD